MIRDHATACDDTRGVTLLTPRLRLRPPVESDAQNIHVALSDFEVTRMLASVSWPHELEGAYDFIACTREKMRVGEALPLVLELRAREARGLIGIVEMRGLKGEPEIGFWLARPHWRCGLMSEAVSHVLAHAFDTYGFETIGSGAFMENAASIGLHRKLGFAITGTSRLFCKPQMCELQHVDMVLSRADFRPSGLAA
ncbi:RimJ/RimL family protein N-acetyltransferase [Breoghania corrubedonensis]|uniref:RimJ/RimL family protein N-acetyltransferase n=1 Tax=Breoghania corrubedonensis TaxID=665038 RepID=A0A2T5VGK0_9HYPH|nr:GNAT family N-acetyltransferase [Breoghania corrubedonensis]PTW62884.1 RimJ/RimL family protein N-acetyltransferase [Breoghania corrubedonensis]